MATGHRVEDALLRAGLVAIVAACGAGAPPWLWLVGGAVALGATATGAPAVLAATALGLAAGAAVARDRHPAASDAAPGVGMSSGATAVARLPSPVIGAGNGALVALALMHLRWPVAPRASTGLGALVAGAFLVAGLFAVTRRGRRRALVALGGLALVAAVAGAGFGIGALRARHVGGAAVSDASAGLAAARRTDTAGAAVKFRAAGAEFAAAQRDVTAWWATPGRFVPGLAQQAEVVARLARAGSQLAATAAVTADVASPEVFRPHAGVVDVGRMEQIRPAVAQGLAVTDRVAADLRGRDSVWLAPPVSAQLDRLRAKLATARDQAHTLAQVVDVLPGMLGADGPRHYFLAVQTPAEMRAGGGIIGNYGELTVDGGRIRLTRFGRIGELNPPGDKLRVILQPADYLERYLRFGADLYFQNATLSPDFPSVATVIEQLYPQSGGEQIDGVVSVDPIALAAILGLTGPVDVPGWPVPLSAANAEQVLLHDQYAQLQSSPTRVDFLAETTRQVVNRLTGATLPGPSVLMDALGPVVRAKHLELHSVRAPEQALIAQIKATGGLPAVNDDFFAVVGQNGSESKIDWYLHRGVTYRPTFDPATGAVHATASVTVQNDAPSSGEPAYILGGADPLVPVSPGQNRMYLSFYSPLGLAGATVDGRPVQMESELEGGRFVYSLFVTVAPKAQLTVELRLVGRVSPGSTYRLDVAAQPTIHPDQFDAVVAAAPGWSVSGPAPASSPLAGDETVAATFRRAG